MRTQLRSHTCLPLLLALSAAVVFSGCGEDHAEEENPNGEACEHLKGGPSVPVSAAATAAALGSAHVIAGDHRRYDVTLAGATGSKGGFLTLQSTSAEYIFFTSAPVRLKVTSPSGATVAAESSATSVAECTEVKGRHVYHLDAIGPHVVEVGPESTIDSVSLVIEAGAHQH